jgi:hypothetical protein
MTNELIIQEALADGSRMYHEGMEALYAMSAEIKRLNSELQIAEEKIKSVSEVVSRSARTIR